MTSELRPGQNGSWPWQRQKSWVRCCEQGIHICSSCEHWHTVLVFESLEPHSSHPQAATMREIVHIQGGQCGNQIGAKFWEVCQRSTSLVSCNSSPILEKSRWSAMSTGSILQAPTRATLTCSWSVSTFTSMRPPEVRPRHFKAPFLLP